MLAHWRTSLVLITFFLVDTLICQNEILEDVHKTLEDKLGQIPGLENFNQSSVPQLDQVEDVIKKKCQQNGGEDAFEKLTPAKDAMQECVESNFNFTQIEIEIEDARKTGSMEEVFGKYCRKKQLVMGCLKNLTKNVEPCLEEKERTTVQVFLNVTQHMVEFFCYKDGDRVAMFIADGGFECLKSKKKEVESCVNSTLADRIPTDLSLTSLPSLVIDDESCKDYNTLHSCVVNALESCDDTTPANIVDSLFKFVRSITPCSNKGINKLNKKGKVGKGGAAGTVVLSSSLMLACLASMRQF